MVDHITIKLPERRRESRVFKNVNKEVKRRMFSAGGDDNNNFLNELRASQDQNWEPDAANGFLSHSKMQYICNQR